MVDLFTIRLNDPKLRYSDHFRVLSSEEKQRASRIRSVTYKNRYVVSHGRLRIILSGFIHQTPEKIQLYVTKSGKPYIDPDHNPELFRFSLSHSKDVAIVAVCKDADIGVDIEYNRAERSFLELAGRYFSEKEYLFLKQLNAHDCRQTFYRIWTMKESWLKATGEGIAGLQTVQTWPEIDTNGIISVNFLNKTNVLPVIRSFQSRHFEPVSGYTACYTRLNSSQILSTI